MKTTPPPTPRPKRPLPKASPSLIFYSQTPIPCAILPCRTAKQARAICRVWNKRTGIDEVVNVSVSQLICDILDRRGLKNELSAVSDDVLENEIKPAWARIIRDAVETALGLNP